jgi:hypothetical protein
MEEKFADLVIQEIHTLGRNVSKLDRKLDIKLKQVYDEIKENKKCNEKAHSLINKKQDDHNEVHLSHDRYHVDWQKESVDRTEGKVGGKMFRWIIGGIIGVTAITLVTFGAFGLATQTKLERHIYFSEFIYHEVTGQKWNDSSRESLLKAKDTFQKHMQQIENGKKLEFENGAKEN